MPRSHRIVPDGYPFHVINRGNRRAAIFHKPSDSKAFLDMAAAAADRIPMRVLAVAVMNNHFHLVLWPHEGIALSEYMCVLMNAHVRHHQSVYNLTGTGHVYQGRFKSFIVQDDVHLLNVLRYVEANPVRAGYVRSADQYRWSSASARLSSDVGLVLSPSPVPRPVNWLETVNAPMPTEELVALRTSVRRSRPYGDERWRADIVRAYGLEHTMRPPGRQRCAERETCG